MSEVWYDALIVMTRRCCLRNMRETWPQNRVCMRGFLRSLAPRLAALALFSLSLQLPKAAQPLFRLYTTEDGLVRNWIEHIRTDSRGNLWFCTVEGISVFDGSHFTNFTVRDGLPNRLVTDVVESWSGDYWIATADGLSLFRVVAKTGTSHFKNFRLAASGQANEIDSLIEDSQHVLWLGTGAGLFRARTPGGGDAISFEPVPQGTCPQERVSALVEDSRHRIWEGGLHGVSLLFPSGRCEHFGTEQGIPLAIRAMIIDDKGRLWVGGEGLAALDANADRPAIVARYRTYNGNRLDITAMRRNPANGDIWMGRLGLIRFRPDAALQDRFHSFSDSPILSHYDISALVSDKAGNLWVGVSTLGALRILKDPGETYTESDGLESAVVVGMMEDRNGKFFAITGSRHTLNELVGTRFKPRRRSQSSEVDVGWGQGSVVLQDRRGEWWVANAYGLLHYPAVDDAKMLARVTPTVYTKRDGCPDGAVLRLFEDSRDDLWVGTSVGLARRESNGGRWTSFPSVPMPVHSITEDRTGSVWAGFAGPHLLRVRGAVADDISSGLPAGYMNALLLDHAGSLWIGSSQGGLGRIDDPGAARPGISKLGMDQGLSSNHIFALAEDRFGWIYVAGGHGVDRLDPKSGAIRHFSRTTLLPAGETERLYRDRNGSIWFASNFGLTRYNPEPPSLLAPPSPLLRRVTIGSRDYPVPSLGARQISGLNLSPEDNHVEIEFRPIDLNATERPRFQYRLRGASDQWSLPSDLQTVHFASLAPGSYVFEARSVAESGVVSDPAVLRFRLPAPVWLRPWFLTLGVLFTATAGFLLHRYRLTQALIVERVRTRLATDLHDDLGAGLAEIAILSEAGRQSPAKTNDALDQVAKRARALRATLGDIVWTVDPRKDRLPALVHRMRETALNMLEVDGRRVRFIAPDEAKLEGTELSPDLRRHLLLFFKEAVANVARHADAREVDLGLSLENGDFHLRIRDDGRGFDPELPTEGRGLTSLRYRAAEMRGRVSIDAAPGKGTEIRLRVPLRVTLWSPPATPQTSPTTSAERTARRR